MQRWCFRSASCLEKHELSKAQPPPSFSFSAPEGDEGEEDEVDEDAPPSFPAMNSIQRARQAMPPPNALPLPASTTSKPVKPRRKVVLEPGYSQLDWAKLKGSGEDLRVRLAMITLGRSH